MDLTVNKKMFLWSQNNILEGMTEIDKINIKYVSSNKGNDEE